MISIQYVTKAPIVADAVPLPESGSEDDVNACKAQQQAVKPKPRAPALGNPSITIGGLRLPVQPRKALSKVAASVQRQLIRDSAKINHLPEWIKRGTSWAVVLAMAYDFFFANHKSFATFALQSKTFRKVIEEIVNQVCGETQNIHYIMNCDNAIYCNVSSSFYQ
jgi:hypothetical protein